MATIQDLPASAKLSAKDGERLEWRWNEDVFECSDVWLVPYGDLSAFLQAAGGTVESIGGVINRVVPLRNSVFPFAIAKDISGSYNQGGWDRNTGTYNLARIRIRYESPKYGEDYLTVSSSPDTRVLYKPASINSGNAQEIIHGTQYNVTVHKLSSLALSTFAAYGGYINNASWRTFPAGCVLYVGPASSQTTTVGGKSSFDVTHTFRVNRVRWDNDYDATGTLVSTGVPPSTDFNSLFGF